MDATQIDTSSNSAKFIYGEHIHIRQPGNPRWIVSYIENVVNGKPVLAMPEAYAQAMLIESEIFECCTNSNGTYQYFNATIDRMRLEKPAYVTFSDPFNVVIKPDARIKKRLIVNILATVRLASNAQNLNAIVENLSPIGMSLTFRGKIPSDQPVTVKLHMPVRNFFKNIVTITGKTLWTSEKNSCTSMGISVDENTVQNAELLEYFYSYHSKA